MLNLLTIAAVVVLAVLGIIAIITAVGGSRRVDTPGKQAEKEHLAG